MPTNDTKTLLPPEFAREVAEAIMLARAAYQLNQSAAAERCVTCLITSVATFRAAILRLPAAMRTQAFIERRVLIPARREYDRMVLAGTVNVEHGVQR